MSAKLMSRDAGNKNMEGLPSSATQQQQQKSVNASVNNWLMNQQIPAHLARTFKADESESPPFPVYRLSNGEYDNIQNNNIAQSSFSNQSMKMFNNGSPLIKPSGVAKVVRSLPNDAAATGVNNKIRPDMAHNNHNQINNTTGVGGASNKVKRMAPPPPPHPLSKRSNESEKTTYSNWKRS